MGKQWKQCQTLFFWAPKSLQMVTAAIKLKDAYSLEGAGGLKELLRMPMRSQGYCGDGRGLSGLHWVCRNGRGPHLEWRQEPQASSPFLTPTAGSLQSWDRSQASSCLRNATLLASRVVHGVTGHLSSCVWNLQFSGRCTGVSVPLRVVPSFTGLP